MTNSRIALAVLAALSTLAALPANAKPAKAKTQVFDAAAVAPYPTAEMPGRAASQGRSHALKATRRGNRSTREAAASVGPSEGDLGGRSGSCLNFRATARLWCGCFAADQVGLDNSDGHWNLAANYFEFPRAEPGHNRVAVRYGHVAVLKTHVSGSIWLAADGNSGGQRARLHEIDLRQFRAVVDPTGVRTSQRVAHRHHARHRRIAARSTSRL